MITSHACGAPPRSGPYIKALLVVLVFALVETMLEWMAEYVPGSPSRALKSLGSGGGWDGGLSLGDLAAYRKAGEQLSLWVMFAILPATSGITGAVSARIGAAQAVALMLVATAALARIAAIGVASLGVARFETALTGVSRSSAIAAQEPLMSLAVCVVTGWAGFQLIRVKTRAREHN